MTQWIRVKKKPTGGFIVLGRYTLNVGKEGEVMQVPEVKNPEEMKEITKDVENLIEDKVIEYTEGPPPTEAGA